jgi:hypothetical protein
MFKNWINDRFFSADDRSRLERARRERGRGRRRATARRALPGLDRLEDRTVLSTSLNGTVLSVLGDDLGPTNDSIVIRENPSKPTKTQVLVNSVVQYDIASAALTQVIVSGLDGDDTITVGNGNLDRLPYSVNVEGDDGTDIVNVNDQLNPAANTYTITNSSLERVVFGGLIYDASVESVNLNAETGNNTVNINSTAAGVTLTVNAGAGNDTINVGNGSLDSLRGAVTVHGGPDTDLVNVNDQADPFNDTYTITGTTLTRPLFGGLTYGASVEGLTLNAEAGDNTVNINSTTAGVALTVNAGAGDDTINVGNGDLDNLLGAVTVNGQGGNDTINVNDTLNPAADTYTLTGTTLTRPRFGGLTYAGIEIFVLNT